MHHGSEKRKVKNLDSSNPSEQALSELEQSTADLNRLIDDAAQILKLQWQDDTWRSVKQDKLKVTSIRGAFREQWVLRWLIKRLKKAVVEARTGHSTAAFHNIKTWALLQHLLTTIPTSLSQDILLGRAYYAELGVWITQLLHDTSPVGTRLNGTSSAELSDHETGRAVKKRKLSASAAVESASPSDGQQQLLLRTVLSVTKISAEPILRKPGTESARTRPVLLWTANVEQAAQTYGSILRLAHTLLTAQSTVASARNKSLASEALRHWNELWTSRTNSTATAKQELNIVHNEYCAAPMLQLLGDLDSALDKDVKQALEKQVALRLVLPARDHFNKHHAGAWKSASARLNWSDITPIHQDLCQRLSAGLELLQQQQSGEKLCTILFSIATRLVPRADLVRQRSEAAWYEALFAALCSIHNPDLLKPDHADSDAMDTSVATTAELGAHGKHTLPVPLIRVLATTGVEPSVRFCRFVLETIIHGSRSTLDMDSFLTFLKINPKAFVTDPDGHDPISLLKVLDTRLQEAGPDNISHMTVLLQEVLPLIIHEYGQSRQLDGFVEFWMERLESVFADDQHAVQYHRNRADTSDSSPDRFWSDIKVFQAFKRMCVAQRPGLLAKKICASVKELMTTIADHVGPVHHISARVAVLSALLETQTTVASFQVASETDVIELFSLLQRALELGNDYQGQRWRYWKLFDTLLRLGPEIQVAEDTQLLAATTFTNCMPRSTDSLSRSRADLLQAYQCFTFAVTRATNSTFVPNRAILGRMVDHLVACLSIPHTGQSFKDTTNHLSDGIEDLQCAGDVVLACIARLCDCPDMSVLPTDSRTQLISSICMEQLMGRYQDQVRRLDTIEAFLACQANMSDVSLTDIYLQAITDVGVENRSITFPSYMFEQAQLNLSKSQSIGLAKTMIQDMKREIEPLTQKHLAEYLTLLAVLIARRPSLGNDGETTQILLQELKRRKLEPDLDTIMVMDDAVISIVGTQLNSAISNKAENDSDFARLALKLVSKKADTKKHDTADNFGGLVAMACLTHIDLFVHVAAEVSNVRIAWRKKFDDEIIHLLQQAPSPLALWKLAKMLSLRNTCSTSSSIESRSTDQVRIRIEEPSFTHSFLSGCVQAHNVKEIADIFPRLVEGVAHLGHDVLWSVVSFLDNACKISTPDAPLASIRTQMRRKLAEVCIAHGDTAFLAACLEPDKTLMLGGASTGDQTGILTAYMYQAYTIKQAKEEVVDATWILQTQKLAMLDTLQAKSATQLVCGLEAANLILMTHPSIVNQHVVDTIIYSLTMMTCQQCTITTDTSSGSTSPQPEDIYLHILRLLSTIMIQYRRRLRGRTHLILPLLENLLKCLFFPANLKQLNPTAQTARSKSVFLNTIPYWLYSRKSSSTPALTAGCARKFSRILQTLCDPPASAARVLTSTRNRTHSNKNTSDSPNANVNAKTNGDTPSNANLNLTDPTRSLKRQISQHTQYLLQTFCQASLDGYLAPATREHLLPGLYTVIEATQIEVLRGMNAAMTDAQRSIWKDLYAEWIRFGKWNGR